MNNASYWARRMKITEDALMDKSAAYMHNLETQFTRAAASIEKDIAAWYQRFAANNAISYAEARRWLTKGELDEFRWTVEEYVRRGEESALDGRWVKELENASARVHISRLEALKLQIQQQAELLHGNQLDGMDTLLRRMYTGRYYTTAYEFQRGVGIGWTMHALNQDTISKALSRPWTTDGQTFSDRIWTNKEDLINSVNTHLTQMVIRGEGAPKTIAALAKDMNVAKYKAGRLVMTESSFISAAAQKDCFAHLGVERFVVVAALDGDTCPVCQDMDGKVFKMAEFASGLTANPYHPHCRCTTAPYFTDMEGVGERAARDMDTNKTVMVPQGMKYGEWREKFAVKPVDVDSPKQSRYNHQGGGGVVKVGVINSQHFDSVSPILTQDVVITDRQIAHIVERHPQDYERYAALLPDMLRAPDYIIQANRPNSAVLLKHFTIEDEQFQLALRLKTADDPEDYQNSIITFMKIRKKEWNRLVNNKNVLYKRE